MRSIFIMLPDDMPPNECEGAFPHEGSKCGAFLSCFPTICRRTNVRGRFCRREANAKHFFYASRRYAAERM